MTGKVKPGEEVFIPLADYEEPAMPAQELLRNVVGRIQALVVGHDPKPFIANDKLKKATMDALDDVVAPPACGPLLAELDRTLVAWMHEQPRLSRMKVLVLPPCDGNAVVETWARQRGHPVLDPPNRDDLIQALPAPLPDLTGDGLIVVPRLEDWFIRHRNGLRTVRALLAALDGSERQVVFGCNSFAWAFLGKAVSADLVLPDAVTFVAFNEMRLHRWFSQLATGRTTGAVRFRRSQSGANVLEQDEGRLPAHPGGAQPGHPLGRLAHVAAKPPLRQRARPRRGRGRRAVRRRGGRAERADLVGDGTRRIRAARRE